MRRGLTAAYVAVAVALTVASGACGDDAPDVEPPAAPAQAGTSPVYGVPLPQGADVDEEGTTPERESFLVPAAKARFVDLDAFYRRQLDEKPFRDLAWCGAVADTSQVYGLRVWKAEGGEDVFSLSLKSEPGVGTYIYAAQAKDPTQECPPPPLDE